MNEIVNIKNQNEYFLQLKNKNNDELINDLGGISKQYYFIVSSILWELRQRFDSDKEFGQFLQSALSNWVSSISPSQRNRYINLGQFIKTYEIDDLDVLGIPISGMYEIASCKDKVKAEKVYLGAKDKNLPVKQIKSWLNPSEDTPIKKKKSIEDYSYQQLEMDEAVKEIRVCLKKHDIENKKESIINEIKDVLTRHGVIIERDPVVKKIRVILKNHGLDDLSNKMILEHLILFPKAYKKH